MTRSSGIDNLELLTGELKNFRDIARYIIPLPGEIPNLEGIDVYGGTMPLIGDVACDRDRAAADAAQIASAIGSVFGARIDAYEGRAFGSQTLRDAAADIRAGAGDQSELATGMTEMNKRQFS